MAGLHAASRCAIGLADTPGRQRVLNTQNHIQDNAADPFCERFSCSFSVRKQILGGCFRFVSNSEALLQLVEVAYGGLPTHQLSTTVPEFQVELRLLPRRDSPGVVEPPPVKTQSGAGALIGVMDAANYVVVVPKLRRALVVASGDMLDHPYHLRYELIEFVVFLLATRGVGLIPLHGVCVGRQGRGVLVLGASGSGKSTLALHSLLCGLELLADDAVFVQPETMLATGVANYLHVQPDALRFVDDDHVKHWISHSPVIRRRSGMAKFEADLRRSDRPAAPTPLELVGAVFLSARTAEDPDATLSPIPKDLVPAMLSADQPCAVGQPGWPRFGHHLMQLGVKQLCRGRHPRVSVDALRQLLG